MQKIYQFFLRLALLSHIPLAMTLKQVVDYEELL
jgi:hypothetical protein